MIVAVVALAACDTREVAAICASFGEPGGDVRAVAHVADGRLARQITDENGSERASETLETPILPQMWRIAEMTMNVLPEQEAIPCGLAEISSVTVVYSDGSMVHRATSCRGNALDRVATQLLQAGAANGTAPLVGSTAPSGDGTARDICEELA